MANEEQFALPRQGGWNCWRSEHVEEYIDLREADLRHVKLNRVNLGHADLRFTNFSKASLRGAHLS
ncbi:hypothetical protein KSX_56860 [Ktedonospora formicarum]|uniref:Pentapeptide repeat-containing protein n=1 Tax=Ktedonospora formicarum TaxID=2778364 RepID=A0A8J3I823_9CHLR|nr:hypothetical protein KSX_56860 [Ktedonospora formicarum]